MNKTVTEAIELATGLKRLLYNLANVDIVLCPPFTALSEISEVLVDSNIKLGAQDLFWEEQGAYTGEISARMLKDVGCDFVIIGHSERRTFFNETNETVNKKIKTALKNALTPIVCIGERLEEREGNRTFDIVETQIKEGLIGIGQDELAKLVIAYEPVWAIGTGKTATPQQAQEVHKFIREKLIDLLGIDAANALRIQYGGSVTPENISGLVSQPDIDGALVGGASLKLDAFSEIVIKTSERM